MTSSVAAVTCKFNATASYCSDSYFDRGVVTLFFLLECADSIFYGCCPAEQLPFMGSHECPISNAGTWHLVYSACCAAPVLPTRNCPVDPLILRHPVFSLKCLKICWGFLVQRPLITEEQDELVGWVLSVKKNNKNFKFKQKVRFCISLKKIKFFLHNFWILEAKFFV